MNEPAIRDLFGAPLAQSPRTNQLALPLGWRRPGARAMVVGDSNRAAIDLVLDTGRWTSPAVVLTGPALSGKSSVGALFAARGGVLVDPLEAADEEALFHAWNRAKEGAAKILVIATEPDAICAVSLPDLATRLATAQIAVIGEPDACLTRDLIEQLLIARGLAPAPQLGSYVAARLERSYAAIHAAVAAIDAAALATGAGASLRTARAALVDAGLFDPAANGADTP